MIEPKPAVTSILPEYWTKNDFIRVIGHRYAHCPMELNEHAEHAWLDARNTRANWWWCDGAKVLCSCCSLDVGPCTCTEYCGKVCCSKVGETATVSSLIGTLAWHQRSQRRPWQCMCGDETGSPIGQARHVARLLIEHGLARRNDTDGYNAVSTGVGPASDQEDNEPGSANDPGTQIS